MVNFLRYLKDFVTTVCLICFFGSVAQAQDGVDDLFDLLGQPDLENWEAVEDKIRIEWSRSGSASMDLLLERARDAMDEGNLDAAREHATALTDHAPDFAEGWNIRASAFFQSGQYGPALDSIRQALALNPRHFGALRGLGIMLEELGYEEQALAAFEAAQAIHPHIPDVSVAIERLSAMVGGETL